MEGKKSRRISIGSQSDNDGFYQRVKSSSGRRFQKTSYVIHLLKWMQIIYQGF